MKKINLGDIFLILISSSIFALAFAYISQYFFGLKPCQLCLYERWIFFAILSIALIAIFCKDHLKKLAFIFSLLLLLANAGLALYHVGVEKKIFRLAQSCSNFTQEDFQSVEELRISLLNQPLARCDEPSFFFLNLSMAAWNALYCASLFLILVALFRLKISD